MWTRGIDIVGVSLFAIKEMRLLHAIGILVLDLPDMSPKKEITTAYHRSH